MARPKKVKEVANAEDVQTVKSQPEATTNSPLYTAELIVVNKFDYKAKFAEMLKKYPENLGYIVFGYIFNDKAIHGNHPFADGTWMNTSLVLREEIVNGERYIHTLNSVYKVRNNASPSNTEVEQSI